MSDVIVKDRIYIRKDLVDRSELKRIYVHQAYKEESCQKCPSLEDRHSHVCDECPAYLGLYELYNKKKFKDKTYYGISLGKRGEYKDVLKDKVKKKKLEVKDLRCNARMKHKIKFTGELTKEQIKPVNTMTKKDYGILESPARSGKCVSGDTVVNTNLGIMPIKTLVDMFAPSERKKEASKEITANDVFIQTEKGMQKVSHVYKKKTAATVEINTSYGVLRGTPEHPVLVLTKKLKLQWVRLDSIKIDDYVCKVPNIDYTVTEEKILRGYAKLMGYLTANANYIKRETHSSTSDVIVFTSGNQKVIDELKSLYQSFSIHYTENKQKGLTLIRTSCRRTQEKLAGYGLSFSKAALKEIPHSVLTSSKRIQIEFLNAYSVCDAYFPNTKSSGIEFCSASPKFISQLQTLLLGLNILSTYKEKESFARNSKTPTARMYYHLYVTGTYRNKLCDLLGRPSIYSDSKSLDSTVPYVGDRLRTKMKNHLKRGRYITKQGEVVKAALISKRDLSYLRNPVITRQVLNGINTNQVKKFERTLAKRISKLQKCNFVFAKVTSVAKKEGGWVYDVSVPETRSFIGNGFICHNTVMMTAVAINKGKRTLVLAAQTDWLSGFYETICGSKTQKALTNVPKLEKKYGYKICVFAKKYEDFVNPNHDIVLVTYQTFLSKGGQKLLKKIVSSFGNIIIDEADMVPADRFVSIINSFESKVRQGCTGTTDRKDGKYFLVDHVIGPIKAKTKIETLTPTVEFIETGVKISHEYKVLAYAYRALEQHKARNKVILEWVKHDLKQGHSIVIPVATVKQCLKLTDMINKAMKDDVAVAFTAAKVKNKKQRDQLIQDLRNRKFTVAVGIRRILQRGINVPTWSALYEVTPISNVPNQTQETARIRTKMEGKLDPVVRHFLDDFGFARGCLRTSLFRVYIPQKFKISKQNFDISKKYTKQGVVTNRQTMLPGKTNKVKARKRSLDW